MVKKADENRLQTFEIKSLREILGITRMDKIRNTSNTRNRKHHYWANYQKKNKTKQNKTKQNKKPTTLFWACQKDEFFEEPKFGVGVTCPWTQT